MRGGEGRGFAGAARAATAQGGGGPPVGPSACVILSMSPGSSSTSLMASTVLSTDPHPPELTTNTDRLGRKHTASSRAHFIWEKRGEGFRPVVPGGELAVGRSASRHWSARCPPGPRTAPRCVRSPTRGSRLPRTGGWGGRRRWARTSRPTQSQGAWACFRADGGRDRKGGAPDGLQLLQ